jgi:2-polyprenyl-6-methoxyphenol hydroxylase-like FAD-dependent oxidoreductase
MKTTRRALVAGAGIAGLTAATALRDLGWAVDLVERRETLDAVPTGLFIPANGMRAFAALGAADALRSRGREITRLNVRAAGGGTASVPLDVVWPQVGPSVAIERETAMRTLQELCPVTVQWGTAVQALTQHGKQASVMLSDGREREYDLVVGADGVNSTVRLATWPDAAARYAGDCWWRGVTACPAGLDDWDLCLCQDGVLLAMPIGEDLAYWAAGIYPARPFDDPVGDRAGRVRARFGDADGLHAQILAQVKDDSLVQFSTAGRVLIDVPVRGRVVLIGDAAHATGPSMAQGASLAAEDVHVLASELAGLTTDVDAALTRYAARRAPRTRYVHETTELRNQVAAQPAATRPALIEGWPALSVQSFAALVPAP